MHTRVTPRFLPLLVVAALALGGARPVEPCTRVLWNENGVAVVTGPNMDWFQPMPVDLYALPRGITPRKQAVDIL